MKNNLFDKEFECGDSKKIINKLTKRRRKERLKVQGKNQAN
jgi:hypothetical protein